MITFSYIRIQRKQQVQFSPLTSLVIREDLKDNSAEILFQSFLQEALVSSSGMGRDVQEMEDYVLSNFLEGGGERLCAFSHYLDQTISVMVDSLWTRMWEG